MTTVPFGLKPSGGILGVEINQKKIDRKMAEEQKDKTEEGKLGIAAGGVGITDPPAITDEERKLIDLFRTLRMDPAVGGTPTDVERVLKDLDRRLHEEKEIKPLSLPADVKPKVISYGTIVPTSSPGTTVPTPSPVTTVPIPSPGTTVTTPSLSRTISGIQTAIPATAAFGKPGYQFPKLSYFYGEDNKGDVTWETFKFEIESLVTERIFTEEQLLLGIRRAVKGTASDIVRRLGTGASVREIVKKLDSTY